MSHVMCQVIPAGIIFLVSTTDGYLILAPSPTARKAAQSVKDNGNPKWLNHRLTPRNALN